MSKKKGFYKMQRGWMENEIFPEKWVFSEREAWTWMIEEAVWKETIVGVGGLPFTVTRGQFTHSIRYLAEKFGWSKSKVAYFINKLKDRDMLQTQIGTECGTRCGTGQLIVTVCNYSKYQDVEINDGTQCGTGVGTGSDQKVGQIRRTKEKVSKKEGGLKRPLLPEEYAFYGKVVRLTEEDWEKWKMRFNLESDLLFKMLEGRDWWLCQQDEERQLGWFFSTAKWLEGQTKGRELE